MRFLFMLVAALTLACVSCKGAKFSGGSSGKSNDEPGSLDATPTPVPKCDLSDEFVKLKFPEDIQKCFDAGNIYHFGGGSDKGSCITAKASASMQCSFAGLKGAIDALGMPTTLLDDASTKGAKLVGCFDKNGGQTIVAQWFYPAGKDDSCQYKQDSSLIVTSCFKQYEGKSPPAPTTREEKRAAVANCIAEAE